MLGFKLMHVSKGIPYIPMKKDFSYLHYYDIENISLPEPYLNP